MLSGVLGACRGSRPSVTATAVRTVEGNPMHMQLELASPLCESTTLAERHAADYAIR